MREGERCPDILTVIKGACRLHTSLVDGRRQIVGFRLDGETVTYPRRNEPWPTTAQASTPTALCRIDGQAIQELRNRYPGINESLDDLAASEVTEAQAHMLTLGRRSPSEKLAMFLLDLRSRRLDDEKPLDEVALPMTRQDIADYLGLETETMSRVFTRMKSDGLISLPRPSRVVLCDETRLEQLAGGAVDSRRRCVPRIVTSGALA